MSNLMLSNTDVFQCYIRMNNANKLFKVKSDIDNYIISILNYIDTRGLKPFSCIKGEGNYPQEYDCICINKFRVKYNFKPYKFVDGIGVVCS